MSATSRISVDQIVDAQPLTRFNVGLWLWCFLLMMLDGYDIAVIAFVAPEFAKSAHVDAASLGMVFSASIVGMTAAAPLFGWIGDRYGRKIAIVMGSFLFGVATLCALLADTAVELAVSRLITGVGLGGVVPNVIAMTAEYAPKRMRARVLAVIGTGIALGSVLPGMMTAASVDWRWLLAIGGIVPIVGAVLSAVLLPESIKYLALHPNKRAALLQALDRVDPERKFPRDVELGAQPMTPEDSASPAALFAGGLASVTSLLWLVCFMNLVVNFFIYNWMPSLFQNSGLNSADAGMISSMFALGGLTGAVVIVALIGRLGFAVVAGLFVLSVPAIAFIGTPGIPAVLLGALVFSSGVCVGGIQIGLNTTIGIVYPTAVRVKGAAWTLGIGRLGSIMGPLVGGALVARQLSIEQMFRVPAVPMIGGALAATALTLIFYRRFGSLAVQEYIRVDHKLRY